ncbi:uncharacterized protein SAZU_5255, partial [Streptomyces azureus]
PGGWGLGRRCAGRRGAGPRGARRRGAGRRCLARPRTALPGPGRRNPGRGRLPLPHRPPHEPPPGLRRCGRRRQPPRRHTPRPPPRVVRGAPGDRPGAVPGRGGRPAGPGPGPGAGGRPTAAPHRRPAAARGVAVRGADQTDRQGDRPHPRQAAGPPLDHGLRGRGPAQQDGDGLERPRGERTAPAALHLHRTAPEKEI